MGWWCQVFRFVLWVFDLHLVFRFVSFVEWVLVLIVLFVAMCLGVRGFVSLLFGFFLVCVPRLLWHWLFWSLVLGSCLLVGFVGLVVCVWFWFVAWLLDF